MPLLMGIIRHFDVTRVKVRSSRTESGHEVLHIDVHTAGGSEIDIALHAGISVDNIKIDVTDLVVSTRTPT